MTMTVKQTERRSITQGTNMKKINARPATTPPVKGPMNKGPAKKQTIKSIKPLPKSPGGKINPKG